MTIPFLSNLTNKKNNVIISFGKLPTTNVTFDLSFDKNYDIAYNNLGVIYLDDLGRVQKAMEMFKKSNLLNRPV